ncbi:hypothetical protein F8154_13105 [Alkaliphilus pronyensis]|uniref:non-specific serine/threonine protein kinase n=1 Tax=Alkaliphilus pronyensis TaxID=1482732 RepID=A0A6I0F5K7_9FIRM|nr:RIO1 family regulatory kinase/ATPase [Alkaliphilus pronyensis]KAB3531265.1 hypothetical protein F8154_13105 [Alkaliphilus pronyensis]
MFPYKVFEKTTNISKYTVDEKYQSKKNEVYRVTCIEGNISFNKCVVVKNFMQSYSSFQKEVHLLTELYKHGLAVPRVYRVEDKCIIMECIMGKTLVDVLNEAEEKTPEGRLMKYRAEKYVTYDLLNWLKSFYCYSKTITGKKIILKDIHLRNFIAGEVLVGVDFESCTEGEVEEDIGKLCAFIATYDPQWTPWKISLVEKLKKSAIPLLSLDKDALEKEISNELKLIKERRKSKNNQTIDKNTY